MFDELRQLSDDRVLEAVNLLAGEALGPTPDYEVRREVAAAVGMEESEISRALRAANPAEVAALARIVLTAYAQTNAGAVERAVAASGRKAFVLETAVIGLLALALVHLLATGGRRSTEHEISVRVSADGEIEITHRERIEHYSLGESLTPIATQLLNKQDE